MITAIGPVEHEPVGELAGEPHPNPASGYCSRSGSFRNEIVERPVEMRQRDIDRDPGHRPPLRRRVVACAAAGPFPSGASEL